jgi:hypothetical protein
VVEGDGDGGGKQRDGWREEWGMDGDVFALSKSLQTLRRQNFISCRYIVRVGLETIVSNILSDGFGFFAFFKNLWH